MKFALAVATLALGGTSLVVSPGPATAQTTQQVSFCGQILSCSSGHVFAEEQDQSRKPSPEGFHGDCLHCDEWIGGEWVEVDPERCHDICDSGFSPDEQVAFAAVLDAATNADIPRLLSVGRRLSRQVHINTFRRSLHVLDCRGRVVATLPLGALYGQAVLEYSPAVTGLALAGAHNADVLSSIR